MSVQLDVVKFAAVGCLGVALCWGTASLARSSDTPLHHAYFRYVANLERLLRSLFLEHRPVHIVWAQAAGMVIAAASALMFHEPALLLSLIALALGPRKLLEHMCRRRVEAIERKLDVFVVALANALRASPSPGRALAMIQPVTPAPLDREIELVLREMRVGSTLEQALGNLSARVRSFQLDAAMSGLLIGRQTGGNVSEILDSSAQTLREMARLQGMLRSRTAEGRAQANVLAVAPLVLIFAFDFTSPGYFKPLTGSTLGLVVTAIAVTLWVSSVVMTRRIVAVQL